MIGFVQPLATITGRVNFGTGDAVKDVSCMMYVKDAISKTMGWRSLLFSNYLTDGQTDRRTDRKTLPTQRFVLKPDTLQSKVAMR